MKADSVKSAEQKVADGDMLNDYSHLNWSKAVRGKYGENAMHAKRSVALGEDLSKTLPSNASINAALNHD